VAKPKSGAMAHSVPVTLPATVASAPAVTTTRRTCAASTPGPAASTPATAASVGQCWISNGHAGCHTKKNNEELSHGRVEPRFVCVINFDEKRAKNHQMNFLASFLAPWTQW
jgi:hypothetical protein